MDRGVGDQCLSRLSPRIRTGWLQSAVLERWDRRGIRYPSPLAKLIERGNAALEQCTTILRRFDALRTAIEERRTDGLFELRLIWK